jgi:hypothetical protein
MQEVARADWGHPAYLASDPDNWMLTERATFNQQPHCNRGCVPSRCNKTLEKSFGGGVFIQMHRLRVKFGREALDVWGGDLGFTSLELHPNGKVVKPLDHGHELSPSNYQWGPPTRIVVQCCTSPAHDL